MTMMKEVGATSVSTACTVLAHVWATSGKHDLCQGNCILRTALTPGQVNVLIHTHTCDYMSSAVCIFYWCYGFVIQTKQLF